MPGPHEYFWLPRGDARVVRIEGGRVTLSIVLASYGPGAPSWDVDHYNALKFFCLQCIVGFWPRYSRRLRKSRPMPPTTSTFPEGSSVAVWS